MLGAVSEQIINAAIKYMRIRTDQGVCVCVRLMSLYRFSRRRLLGLPAGSEGGVLLPQTGAGSGAPGGGQQGHAGEGGPC